MATLNDAWFLHPLTLDTADGAIPETLYAFAEDSKGRGIDLTIKHQGDVCDLTGCSVLLAWRHCNTNESSTRTFTAVSAAQGHFKVTYPTSMEKPGLVKARIIILKGDTFITGSRIFKIVVPAVITNDMSGTSNDDLSTFQQAAKDATTAGAAANAAASAANAAAGSANSAASAANKAAGDANSAASAANTAKSNADEATKKANDAAAAATASAGKADQAAASANSSASAAGAAATAANNATSAANDATGRANSAADEAEAFLKGFIVEYDNLSDACKEIIASSAGAGVEFATQAEIDDAFETEILPILAGGEMDNALTEEEYQWAIGNIFS